MFHDVGVRGGDVGLLTGVSLEVKELPIGLHGGRARFDDGIAGTCGGACGCFGCLVRSTAFRRRGVLLLTLFRLKPGLRTGGVGVDEVPALGADAAVGEFELLRIRILCPASDVGEERAVFPGCGRIFEQRDEAAAFDLLFHVVGERGTGEFGERGEEIDVRGERIDGGGLQCAGPAPEAVRFDAAHPRRAFGGAESGVVVLHTGGAAVVIDEDDERVFLDAPLFELREQFAEVFVDVVDHAVKVLRVGIRHFVFEERLILRTGDVRPVRGIRGDVAIKRLFAVFDAFDPFRGLAEENVGAVALGLLESAVVEDGGVEVFVSRRVAAGAGISLPDAASTVDEHFIKAARGGPAVGFIAEVPLSKDAGGVASGLQNLRERGGVRREALALEDGVRDAVFEFVTAGEQRGARGCAGGADAEVLEAHALRMQAVHVRRFEDGIAVAGDVGVALIVSEEENDVRLFARETSGVGGKREQEEKGEGACHERQ